MSYGFLEQIDNFFRLNESFAALNYLGVTILTCLMLLQNYKPCLTLEDESLNRLQTQE